MAFDPARAAFRALSRCHTVQHVYSEVVANFYKTFSSTPPTGCFNPMRWMVTEITVIKRCCLVQHEGLFIGLCYQQPAQPAQPADFYLVINHAVNCRSCTKLVIDRVECTTTQTQPSGWNHAAVWRMPFDNVNNFQLNLAQLAIILNFIADEAILLAENCFWFTHATRQVISRQVFNHWQDPDAFIVPHFWLWRIGTCFNWHVDHVGQNQIDHSHGIRYLLCKLLC